MDQEQSGNIGAKALCVVAPIRRAIMMEAIEYRQFVQLDGASHMVAVTRQAMKVIQGDDLDRSQSQFIMEFGDMVDALARVMIVEDRTVGWPKHILSAEWIGRALITRTITEQELRDLHTRHCRPLMA